MAKQEQKQLAYTLYMETDLNQREIAAKVKVTEKTLCKWIKEGEWEVQKSANSVTRKKQIVNYMMQLNELNQAISERPKGKRYATPAESDTINKITKSIEVLEKTATLSDYVLVSEEMLKFLTLSDSSGELSKSILPHMNEFIQLKAKELTK